MTQDSTAEPAKRVETTPRRRLLRAFCLLMAGGAVLGLGGPAVLTRAMSSGRIVTSAVDAPSEDVVMVLGAQIYPDGTPSPYLRGRLDLATELYRLGKVKVILVSGDNSTSHYDEPTGMRNYLIKQGIPADKVVADFAGFDTYDSCVRAKKIFGVSRMLVVTQTYHLYRAIATCRMVGVDAFGVGDSAVRERHPREWTRGTIREVAANIKMLWDIGSHRQPTLGRRETGVDKALGR